ncbi:hypothetical protein CERSUDRAFT_60537 [Gelatoporia subvermispora B]|uniref:GED domain-containing protein n=1 Tax=Ceriporiopsis subvermispora (strain B) TaxID=914234 RepID=M2P6W1_CERS8|nr:hypothetical protein CERSUDRAFT_60537 [Gelatoporia subvermispora B]
MPHDSLVSPESSYAQRRKQLLALIKQLRAIGAQADLDLPRIAVIGNQSAGKSSLVEAISGITVPRDAGTCTRCPMELRLSSSEDPWSCQISIRWEYGPNNERNDEIREVMFGGRITNKDDVELALRRAQAAVLNPEVPSARFINMSAEELWRNFTPDAGSLLFSRNVVCIDLVGPDLTDLSFIDLPGIIQNADPDIVKLVEDLVRSHIKGHCLILVTLPMSDDIENQKAAQIARQEDPSGLRTIGVLTKPDTLPPGSTKMRDLWLDVIKGRRHPLMHGYFCTRQPDDEERVEGITAAEARAAENLFFASTHPWLTSARRDHFGTKNLVANLSKHLTQIIDEVLPKLQGQVGSQLSQCNAQLNTLPPPITTEPSAYILSLVSAFCNEVQAHIQGGPGAAALVQKNRRTYATYKRAIRSTAPPFMPFPSSNVTGAILEADLQWYHDDLDDNDNDGENSGETETNGTSGGEVNMSNYVYLEDIRRHIQRYLPNNIPYPAKVELIRAAQSTWEEKSHHCFDAVHKECLKTMMDLIGGRFSRYENLRTRVRLAVQDLIKERFDGTLLFLRNLLKLETTPFTQNDHYLADKTAASLAQYKEVRAGKASPERVKPMRVFQMTSSGTSNRSPFSFADPPSTATSSSWFSQKPAKSFVNTATGSTAVDYEQKLSDAFSALAALGYHGITAEDLPKLRPPDEYEEELQVMAEVRAYFQVAYKRVIDYVPLSIDHTFLYTFAEALQPYLIERLGIGSQNAAARCQAYISEDPHVIAQREELMGRKKRLESVQTELFNFGL